MAATTVPAQYRMAHDIATHLQHLPSGEAAEAVAAHIHRFWDPRMRAQLMEQVGRAATGCDPTVAAAVDLLKNPDALSHPAQRGRREPAGRLL